MYNVDISEVANVIDVCPKEINLMLLGDSGIGKTTVIEKYCKDHNYFLKTLILSQLEPSEALGVPITSEREYNGHKYKTMESATPAWVFDLAEHENAVLFLDELLCADPSVMNSFLNLLSQKCVNGIDLSHVKFIAATNIGLYTFTPDFNFLTRFCFFHVTNKTYDKNMPFIYTYSDDSEYDGPIFAERRLVPRCATSLKNVPAKYIPAFYEGFTNSKPVMNNFSTGLKFSNEISAIIFNFATKEDTSSEYYVKDEMLKAMSETLYKNYPRSYKAVINSISILTDEQKNKAANYDFKTLVRK